MLRRDRTNFSVDGFFHLVCRPRAQISEEGEYFPADFTLLSFGFGTTPLGAWAELSEL